jgi:hypothetical protein
MCKSSILDGNLKRLGKIILGFRFLFFGKCHFADANKNTGTVSDLKRDLSQGNIQRTRIYEDHGKWTRITLCTMQEMKKFINAMTQIQPPILVD